MTKPKPKAQLQKRGRKSLFRPESILVAKAMARVGAIDEEIADELGINRETFHNWRKKYPELANAVKAGKEVADERVERSLFHRAIGYSHTAVKILTVSDGAAGAHIEKVEYIENYPPDTAAMCFWLKNRRPDRWRDVQNIDHAVGHYVISEKPLSESDWIKLHASNAADLELKADQQPSTTPSTTKTE